MAEFNTVVEAVHAVYQEEGGVYTESTVPDLMQVASALYDAFEVEIKAKPDRAQLIIDAYYSEIIDALRQLA